MKKKWQELSVVALFCVIIGWWGFLYPELEKNANTYAIVMEDGTILLSSELREGELQGCFQADLEELDGSRIKVSSRLWKLLQEFWEEDRSEQ